MSDLDPCSLQATLENLRPEALEFLEDLVAINSFTENPEGVSANADRIVQQFSSFGFSEQRVACTTQGTGSHLILDSGGPGPVIACIGHLDTVFTAEEELKNGFRWTVEGERIFGPGTIDIKGGTALLWMTLQALAIKEPDLFRSIRWVLLWNAAEEKLVSDFGELCSRVLPPETTACLVFEADGGLGDFSLLRSRKGRATFQIKVSGRGAHAGVNFAQGANAIHQLALLVDKVARLSRPEDEITVNVGKIQGGTVVNRVPHEAWAEVEIRGYDPRKLEAVCAEILKLDGPGEIGAASDGFRCHVSVRKTEDAAPWPQNPATERLLTYWQEAAKDLGRELQITQRGGLSDANFLWQNFPTLDGLGPRGKNAHVSERTEHGLPEFLEPASLVPKALLNCHALRALMQDAIIGTD